MITLKESLRKLTTSTNNNTGYSDIGEVTKIYNIIEETRQDNVPPDNINVITPQEEAVTVNLISLFNSANNYFTANSRGVPFIANHGEVLQSNATDVFYTAINYNIATETSTNLGVSVGNTSGTSYEFGNWYSSGARNYYSSYFLFSINVGTDLEDAQSYTINNIYSQILPLVKKGRDILLNRGNTGRSLVKGKELFLTLLKGLQEMLTQDLALSNSYPTNGQQLGFYYGILGTPFAFTQSVYDNLSNNSIFKNLSGVYAKLSAILKDKLDTVNTYIAEIEGLNLDVPEVIPSVEIPLAELLKKNSLDVVDINGDSIYNVVIQPIDGGGVIKIPKLNSKVFISKLNNEDYFLNQASEYDEMEVVINNELQIKQQQQVFSVKADIVNLLGLKLGEDIISTENINKLSFKSEDNRIVIEKDIELIGNKVLIGKTGEPNYPHTTPYDNDVRSVAEKVSNLGKVLDVFSKITNLPRVSVWNTNWFDITNINTLITRLSITEYNFEVPFNTLNEYTSAKSGLDATIADMRKLLKEMATTSKDPGSDFYIENYQYNNNELARLSSSTKTIQNTIDLNFANFILRNEVVILHPRKPIVLPRSYENVGVYSVLMPYIQQIDSELYLSLLNKLKKSTFRALFGPETRIRTFNVAGFPSATYISPEDASAVILNELMVRYTLLKSLLVKLTTLRANTLSKSTYSELSDSVGIILHDFCNTIIGGLNSYIINPAAPPPYITNNGVPEGVLDSKLETQVTNINDLLK